MLLLFLLKTEAVRRGIDLVFLQYTEQIPALDEVEKELSGVCPKWCATDVTHESTVPREDLHDKSPLNFVE